MLAKAPRFYRLLLLLLPTRFRQDFGSDLEAVLVDRLCDARGPAARGWIWLIAVADVFTSAPAEWAHALRDQRTGSVRGRGVRWTRWLEDVVQDVRYGIRLLVAKPGFTFAAVVTLALGIGATTVMFGVVDALFL
ncbi:MAG: hypothetical protein ACRELX_15360, partial [Longimicrobiales bacterium]